eukprot:TRINITY_DN8737_c0_g1_i1.p1 TRINITY_DN8737_c0_g1~~TRINITY_DN8737_c0_g1_i1.p1  ORF type:complete len:504 (-),score=122.19 TRINITY_DN8737_c0_g1_i1:59-1570(-)
MDTQATAPTEIALMKRRIGKMFMIGFYGTEPNTHITQMLREWGVNVILFTRNARDGADLATLTKSLRDLTDNDFLIAIDHEGSPVCRLSSNVSQLPANMGITATGDPKNARTAGEIAGRELAAMGIDVNLAPVLDVNTQTSPGCGIRAYGDTAGQVIEYGMEYLEGLQSTGISATAKHWPGKGAASLDAHFDLPVISRAEKDCREVDLLPFLAAIKHGIHGVMSSHPIYRGWADEVPCTFSKKLNTDLLRTECGFQGVLFTDCLEMNAMKDHFGFENVIKSSVLAGNDILLVCHDPVKQVTAMQTVLEAVKSGEIPESRIEEAVKRIDILVEKHKWRRMQESVFVPIETLVERHRPTLERLWRESVVLRRDPNNLLPLTKHKSVLVLFAKMVELSPVEEKTGDDPSLLDLLKGSLPNLDWLQFTPKDRGQIEDAVKRAAVAEVTVIFSYNAHLDEAQRELIEKVRDSSQNLVLVPMRNPYDEIFVREKDTCLLYTSPSPRDQA